MNSTLWDVPCSEWCSSADLRAWEKRRWLTLSVDMLATMSSKWTLPTIVLRKPSGYRLNRSEGGHSGPTPTLNWIRRTSFSLVELRRFVRFGIMKNARHVNSEDHFFCIFMWSCGHTVLVLVRGKRIFYWKNDTFKLSIQMQYWYGIEHMGTVRFQGQSNQSEALFVIWPSILAYFGNLIIFSYQNRV